MKIHYIFNFNITIIFIIVIFPLIANSQNKNIKAKQDIIITGVVKDYLGPIPNANVRHVGTDNIVQTNIDGIFKITIPESDFTNKVNLKCTYPGLKDMIIDVFKDQQTITVIMVDQPEYYSPWLYNNYTIKPRKDYIKLQCR